MQSFAASRVLGISRHGAHAPILGNLRTLLHLVAPLPKQEHQEPPRGVFSRSVTSHRLASPSSLIALRRVTTTLKDGRCAGFCEPCSKHVSFASFSRVARLQTARCSNTALFLETERAFRQALLPQNSISVDVVPLHERCLLNNCMTLPLSHPLSRLSAW